MRSNKRFTTVPGAGIAVCMFTAILAGCGGSDDHVDPPIQIEPPAPATVDVPVTVIDGPIQNAKVCVDVNSNSVCDPTEPSATTDAAGKAVLKIVQADAGKYAVLAEVGANATDADTGAVTVPFLMKAPADRTGVISPLTTMVQSQIERAGGTTADAESFVKGQTGISTSLFDDYTPAGGGSNSNVAVIARLIVVTAQQQASALASIVGQVDRSGAAITAADINGASNGAVLSVLDAVSGAAIEPAIQAAATREAAILARAQQIAQEETGLDASNAANSIGLARIIAAAPAVAEQTGAAGTLRAFTFTDTANWFYRANLATPADNVADAAGLRRFYDVRSRSTAGTIQTWGFGASAARAGDVFWSGSAWITCPLGTRSTASVRGADGVSQFNYCNGYNTGQNRRVEVDIAGRSLTSVIQEIRAFPGGDSGVNFSAFGPTNLAALGTATFAADSKLLYQSSTSNSNAYAYDVQASTLANVTVAAVAAGGDARTNPSVACAQVLPTTPSSEFQEPATSLEMIISRYTGTPCIFGPGSNANGNTLPTNEWWSNSALSYGTIANGNTLPAGTGNYYTTSLQIRVAFTGPGAVTYYRCYSRTGDTSGRNCSPIGPGTYSIVSLGDARVLTFSNPPALAASMTYLGIMVERAGVVRYGYQSKSRPSDAVRLNLPAANSLFTQLGIPVLAPQ